VGTVEIGDRRVRERDQEGLRVARVGVTRVRADRRQIDGHRGDRLARLARHGLGERETEQLKAPG
jgi:hypothetical protein